MRNSIAITATLLGLGLAALPAHAGNGNGNAKAKAAKTQNERILPVAARSCPPGLAKKSPSCVPPGLAKTGKRYDRGQRIDGDYGFIRDYDRYGLNRDNSYVRVGDVLYRVNPRTREVLDVIGAVARLLD